ncbi:MAG: hypothetical protein QT05_C0007G0006 [archaeon GW2011_AR13]|nr:MAG: hypothetical protein QT05_C0007G0006 [archaeon GW2011_AR13]HIG94025.1 hypothetical protein [Nanoarchaeota archaeon]HIH63783.1 hypothetical protein [Nanoarchaeota archaeon]HIJ09656.1 hypothetical protein [Nanoarchaeota archaeon]
MDKKVRIDDYLLKEVKKFREGKKINKIKYPTDKQFIQIAVLKLLELEMEK